MDFGAWIYELPLWALFLITLAVCLVSVEAGSALARFSLRMKEGREPEAPLGSLVGAVLGLLAFILAFAFGMTASRFDARKQLVLAESNAVGTTYLRAALLPPNEGTEIRKLLRDYVALRLTTTTANASELLEKSEQIHDRLWSQATALVHEDMDSELRTLFIASLNELIDLHQSRVTVALQYRIPGEVWLSIFLLAALSMLAVGYQVGMSGNRRLRGTPIVAAAFSMVIVMIADIDSPGRGMMRVNQQPLVDIQQMMQRNAH